jgi:hypothetical protein
MVVDLNQSDSVRKLDQIGKTRVRQILNGPSNEFVFLDYERNVWLLNESATEIQRPNLTGQGEALSATFADDGKLWIAYRVSNVAAWDLKGNTVAQVLSPRSSVRDLIFQWILKPMYMIAQRPAEMEDLQEVLVTNASKSIAVTRNDMDMIDQEKETGTSILSNMIFVSVILAICCLYLYRQDL